MNGEQNNLPLEEKKEESTPETMPEEAPKEIGRAYRAERKSGINFGKLLMGLFLISFGLFLLGQSAGYISQDLNIDIFQFWPLLVIALGLSFLDTRRPLSFVLGLLVFIAVAALVGTMVRNGTSQMSGTQKQNIPIEIDKDAEVDFARIDIKTNVANLEVAGGAGKLVEGNFRSDNMQLEKSSSVSNRTQNVSMVINNPSDWNPFFEGGKSDLNLKLNSDLPTDLFFDLNVTDAVIDLGTVSAKSVDIRTNVSDLELVLSDKRDLVDVKVKANVGQTKIVLPESSGVRITLNSSISSQNLTGFEKISETEYRTSNYDSSSKKVDMNLDINVSDLTIARK